MKENASYVFTAFFDRRILRSAHMRKSVREGRIGSWQSREKSQHTTKTGRRHMVKLHLWIMMRP